jgi:hypothetical protein
LGGARGTRGAGAAEMARAEARVRRIVDFMVAEEEDEGEVESLSYSSYSFN